MPMIPFDLLTEQARRAIWLSCLESRWFNHDHVGTHHLLIALLREPTPEIERVINAQGRSADAFRCDAILEMEHGKGDPPTRIALTPRFRRVIERAMEFAAVSHRGKAGANSILLALLTDPECEVPHLLRALGLDLEAAIAGLRDADPEPDFDQQLSTWVSRADDPRQWSSENLTRLFSQGEIDSIEIPYDLRNAVNHSVRALGRLVQDVVTGNISDRDSVDPGPPLRSGVLQTSYARWTVALIVGGWILVLAAITYTYIRVQR